jgi:hypothetical protein
MTKRDFYTAISNGTINDELMAMASAELEKMDAANEKRKEKTSKKAEENQPLVDRIANEILGAEPMTATDVAAVMELSVQKTSALCRAAVAQGKAVQTEVKVPKKGNQKAYTKA